MRAGEAERINEKREQLARHVQQCLKQEELKKKRRENWGSIRYCSEAVERGDEMIPRFGYPVSLQVLTVMRVLCENKEKGCTARLAELETPSFPRQSSGPSVQKHTSADYSPEEGDLEYKYPGSP